MDGPSHTSRFTVQCIQVVVCASTGSEARIVVEESRDANGLGGGGEEAVLLRRGRGCSGWLRSGLI